MYEFFLSTHIACGITALSGALLAMLTQKGGQAHRRWGRIFALGMAGMFLTAFAIIALRPQVFLALIAVFSFYLAATGWLRAHNRSGKPTWPEWLAALLMLCASLVMLAYGTALLLDGDRMGWVMTAFGFIGGTFAGSELVRLRSHAYKGKDRLIAHANRMLGGTIAVITAVAVVNIDLGPGYNYLVWLLPTLVITPAIVYWNIRLRQPTGLQFGAKANTE